MNLRPFLLYLFVLLLTVGCKATVNTTVIDSNELLLFKDHRTTYKKPVAFGIFNNSKESVLIASTYHLFIEQYNYEYKRWERLPYRPCRCVGPCPSPSIVELEAGATISIVWDRYQVTCGESSPGNDNTEEVFQKKGLYRLKFHYTPIVDGKKSNSGILIQEFRLR